MRETVTAGRLNEFMRALGSTVKMPTRVYLVGGASAVLLGWRDSTIDIDLKLVPERDEILRQFSDLKERFKINIELASPDDFVPPLPGWEDRSQFVRQDGKITFLHYDFYAQALAKIERGHETDLLDLKQMSTVGLIDANRLLQLFSQIESEIHRYPALDAKSFRRKVEDFVNQTNEN